MTEISLTWGNIIALISVMISMTGLVGGVIFAIYKQIRAVKSDLDSYKLEVSRDFVSNNHLTGMKEDLIRSEERTLAAINNLAERFDRFLSKTS